MPKHLFNLRISVAERDRWNAAAQARGLSIAAWLRAFANEATSGATVSTLPEVDGKPQEPLAAEPLEKLELISEPAGFACFSNSSNSSTSFRCRQMGKSGRAA